MRPPGRIVATAILFAVSASSLDGAVAGTTAAARFTGRWLTETRDGVIDVAPCGRFLCGRIVGMVYQPGHEPRDAWHRTQCGLNLLIGMVPRGDGWSGRILDPDNGRTYAAHVRIGADGSFKLHGYVGIPLFGATQTWTRFGGGPIGPACRMAGPGA